MRLTISTSVYAVGILVSTSSILVLGNAGCTPELPDVPACGDGIRDIDEACDDGNLDSGDACTAACQLPGTQLECVTLLQGQGSLDEDVNALLPLSDGSFLAAGSTSVEGQQVGWIGRYGDSEGPIWLTLPPPADEGSSSIIDISADGSEGYWALLTRGPSEDLIHLDSTGQLDIRIPLMDLVEPAGFAVSAKRLLVVDRQIWLAGRGGAPDLWVGRFDIDAQTLTTAFSEDYAGFDDQIWALARNESEIAFAATVNTSPSMDGDVFLNPTSDVLVVRLDLQGVEIGRDIVGSTKPSVATRAYAIAADGSDGWVVGGVQYATQDIAVVRNAWVTRIHPGQGWVWTSTGPIDDGATIEDVLVSDRETVAVGGAYAEASTRAWLTAIGLDGESHWEQDFVDTGYSAAEQTVAIWDHAGQLRTAGRAWNLGETSVLRSCLVAH